MRLVVQGDEAPGQRTDLTDFRLGLREYAEITLDRELDRVILIEPNSHWHESLSALWAGWAHVEIVTGTVRSEGLMYRADDPTCTVLSSDPRFVRTHRPLETPRPVALPVVDLGALAHGAAMISLDATTESGCLDQAWGDIAADVVVINLPQFPSRTFATVDVALAKAGYRRSGRAWGPAGSSSTWVRAERANERLMAGIREARVRTGAAIVKVRELLPRGDRGRAWRQRARVAADWNLSARDILDPALGQQHRHLHPHEVRREVDALLAASEGSSGTSWKLSSPPERDPYDVALECRERWGVWPISFSYPGQAYPLQSQRQDLISPIIPGFPYSFSDADEYMRAYGSASLAVTHRKAGWDCFRHVEILAAGSIPLMLDIDQVPPYSMVHYPRKAMADVLQRMRSADGVPDASVFQAFRAHFDRHLTSEAMARYVLRASGLTSSDRILFVERQHPHTSDYQSTLALVGLKQVLGNRVESMFPAPWIFDDFDASTLDLYGRGFGYTRCVPAKARTDAEVATAYGEPLFGLDVRQYDAVVIGSCSRNATLAEKLLSEFPASRTIWLHTEDTPPLPRAVRWMKESGAHVFVRAIDARP